jgi:hypothetical protein
MEGIQLMKIALTYPDCTYTEAQPTTETVMDHAMTPSNINTEG